MKRGLSKFHLIGLFIIVFVVSIMFIIGGKAAEDITCIDNDVDPSHPDGLNYYKAGKVSLISATLSASEFSDHCEGDRLKEYVCDGDTVDQNRPLYLCPGGPGGCVGGSLNGRCDRVNKDNDNVFAIDPNNACDGCTDCDDNNLNVQGEISCKYDRNVCGEYSLCIESCPVPPQEVCDSIDNDCDGVNNNGFVNLGNECSNGVGECVRRGEFVCKVDGSGTECNAVPVGPVPELCDGLDNNCDGVSDESFSNINRNVGVDGILNAQCSVVVNSRVEPGRWACDPNNSERLFCDPTLGSSAVGSGQCISISVSATDCKTVGGTGSGSDVSMVCEPGYIAVGIHINNFNSPGGSVSDYSIECCRLI
ncbi:MAG: MopE-related protein [Nanoarchaeota archaeon]